MSRRVQSATQAEEPLARSLSAHRKLDSYSPPLGHHPSRQQSPGSSKEYFVSSKSILDKWNRNSNSDEYNSLYSQSTAADSRTFSEGRHVRTSLEKPDIHYYPSNGFSSETEDLTDSNLELEDSQEVVGDGKTAADTWDYGDADGLVVPSEYEVEGPYGEPETEQPADDYYEEAEVYEVGDKAYGNEESEIQGYEEGVETYECEEAVNEDVSESQEYNKEEYQQYDSILLDKYTQKPTEYEVELETSTDQDVPTDAPNDYSDETIDYQEYESADSTFELEDLTPFTMEQMDENVEVRYIPGKGRCLFARKDFQPGALILVELPTLVAVPSLDPPLWEALKEMHQESPLDLPPIWHLAAIYSLSRLPRQEQNKVLDKWVPDPNAPPGPDVRRTLERLRLPLDPKMYERFLHVWQYNSFGHHQESDGLVLYNRISLIAHSCGATACWHYIGEEGFALRARNLIGKGEEITISYIGDEDLLKCSHLRRESLSGWLFTCGCKRCSHVTDFSRGFSCPTCGCGTCYFKTVDKNVIANKCTLCKVTPSEERIQEYVSLETAYIERLAETEVSDIVDVEHVYSEAQRLFNQHWVLYELDTKLFEGYKLAGKWAAAAVHQKNRIAYAMKTFAVVSYTLAWLHEELGDIYASMLDFDTSVIPEEDAENGTPVFDGFHRNQAVSSYEAAMSMLVILGGNSHDYTKSARRKLEAVVQASNGCFAPVAPGAEEVAE